jgi:hypothetical protein
VVIKSHVLRSCTTICLCKNTNNSCDYICPFSLLRLHLSVTTFRRPLDQSSQREIIHDILHPLDIVLDGISPLPQDIVLEIEQLEARKQVLDEGADDERQLEVAQRDGVGRQARELLRQVGEGEEVLLEREVEGVAVLEVGGHGEDGADLLEGEEAAERGLGAGGGVWSGFFGQAAEPGGVDGCADGALDGAGPLLVVSRCRYVSEMR